MSDYPAVIPLFDVPTGPEDVPLGEPGDTNPSRDHTELEDAQGRNITAIAMELGPDASGSHATVKDRMAADEAALAAHLADTSDAHDASAISYAGGTTISATDVEGALDEVGTEKENKSEKSQANGYASLDGSGKVPVSELPDTVVGAVDYKGTWNASTNTPDLPASTPDKGDYYVVAVAGSTSLGGITDWKIGDWAIYNGSAWEKVDNTDQVTSVFGRQGTVVAQQSDYDAFFLTPAEGDAAYLAKPALTDGSLLFASGGQVAHDAANLVWDDANDSLLLGTATPLDAGVRLQVVGKPSEAAAIFKDSATTPGPTVMIQSSGGANLLKLAAGVIAGFGGIWGSVTPSVTNYALMTDGLDTNVNAPTGRSVFLRVGNVIQATLASGSLTLAEGLNIIAGTTTGTKIGTAVAQKLALWGATPVTQRSFIAAPTGGAVADTEARTAINEIRQVLIDVGIKAAA